MPQETPPAGTPPEDPGLDVLDSLMTGASCLLEGPLDSCLLVIVGASGDLAGRKLVPALYNLFTHQGLPQAFGVVGVARTPWSEPEFRQRMHEAVAARLGGPPPDWEAFASRLRYQPLAYDQEASFRLLGRRLAAIDRELGTSGNRVFNLAIPPDLYAGVVGMLGRAGLARRGTNGQGWARLVVEKPFGRDLASARALDAAIAEHFSERQVFRIDHYLAKETVQNILMLRFANAIFEPIWNRNYVDHVSIMASETLGVEHRAGYYERTGVLRDMFQNHMMQLLSLCAMEPPSLFFADRVRDEKTKLFRSLRPFPVDEMDAHLVLGQYAAGQIGGRPVPAYRDEPGVDPQSLTPTYGLMKVFIDNWRWQGVPFFLVSGKRLAAKVTRMVIHFREVPHSLFRQVLGPRISANRLVLGMQPDESISLGFQAKNPGARLCLRSADMFFDFHQGERGPLLEAYEKALLDCMQGDQMLFWRQDGVELCWAYLEDLIRECESCVNRHERLKTYPAGGWGPTEARGLLGGRPLPWA